MKKTIQISLLLVSICFCGTFTARAQMLTQDDIKTQLIAEWERAKVYTDQYLDVMPAKKYSFIAADSIRSFAQQMLHLAAANIFIMMNATGATPPAFFGSDIEHSATAQSRDSVAYYVDQSYDWAAAALKNLPLDKWGEKIKLFGFEMTRFALMIKAFEHQTHHRGQTTIYIRSVGIKPPQEKLF